VDGIPNMTTEQEMSDVNSDIVSAIRDYWEQPTTVSIIDSNLHQIEIDAALRYLLPTDRLADVGCGNGEATVRYARYVRECVALERSAHMRAAAARNVEAAGLTNVTLKEFDILTSPTPDAEFDALVSQRMLINLASWPDQQQGIRNLHRMLKVGGRAILIENTNDAFQAMNDVRVDLGLGPVPQHWHNRFFDHDELMAFVRGGFQVLHFQDFGLYYLLTRVYTQLFASFEGYGATAKKDPIFEAADKAARLLYENMRGRVQISGCRAFGPIQVFVLRREAGEWRS
jgi:ubiquinone/menaquinone biosynthesis C-methylase UbiE